MKKTVLLCSMLMASGLAMAQQDKPRFYMGASVGEARVNAGEFGDLVNNTASQLSSIGVQNVSSKVDEGDTAFKIFGGYQFNKWFAVEGGYADFGKFTANLSASDARVPFSLSGSAEAKSSAWFLDAVGYLPANESFSVFGKAGIAYTQTEVKVNGSGNWQGSVGSFSYNEKENEVVPKLGVGMQINATNNLSFRVEYEVYFNVGDDQTTGESNVNMFTAGAMFRF